MMKGQKQPKVLLRNRFFGALAGLSIRHKTIVFTLVGILTVASLICAPHLKILTTRQGMTRQDLPEQKRFNEYMENFGTPTQLVVLLEGDSARIKSAADDVAAALMSDRKWVRNVFYKVDISALEKSGLYYLKAEDLEKGRQFLDENQDWLRELSSSKSFAEALDAAGRFPKPAVAPTEDLEEPLKFLDSLLDQWSEFLSGAGRTKVELVPKSLADELTAKAGGAQASGGGYILGRDGRSALLFVQQSQVSDDSSFTVPFMAYCRQSAAAALKKHPGVKAGFTGWPVAIEEEVKMLKRDLSIVVIGGSVGIFLLLLVSLRSIRKTLFVFVPHTFGVIWNLGVTYLTVGHLNYFSSLFFGLLFSLGMDYGIVFIRRFAEERTRGSEPAEAITRTFQTVGPGIVTSSMATIAAFLAIGISDAPGFSEMGIVAATGMFCLVVATLVILPPILLIFGLPYSEVLETKVVGSRSINGIWRLIEKSPRVFVIAWIVITAGAIAFLPKLKFDYSIDNMLPAHGEMLEVATRLEKLTGYKTQYLVVSVDDIAQVRKVHKALVEKPTVEHVESLDLVVPEDQERKEKILKSMSAIEKSLSAMNTGQAHDTAEVRTKIAGFVTTLERYQEEAFSSGHKKLVGQLGELIDTLSGIVKLLDAPDAPVREEAFEAALAQSFSDIRERIGPMLAAPPVTIESLPSDLKDRFVGANGKLAIMVFPKDEIWNIEFLGKFVTDVRGAAGLAFGPKKAIQRISGFGDVYLVTSKMVTRGIRKALVITLSVVALLLLLDLRRIRDSALAALPFVAALSWTLALFVITGLGLNLASQLALPVLIGIGVDFGVHTMHRWHEPDGEDLGVVVSTMGASLWLAGLTMLIGFGVLLLAQYRGLVYFGMVLFLGIFLCIVGAMFGLPALIKTLHLDRGGEKSVKGQGSG
jgi:predicted RND superfamily exporter protein